MQPVPIKAFTTGLQTNLKSNIIPDDAFQVMNNAYIENAQVKRRQGPNIVGRLRRAFVSQALTGGADVGTTTTFNIFTELGMTISDANKEIDPGSVVIVATTIPDETTFTDNGDGTFILSSPGQGIAANTWINYVTGDVSISFDYALAGGEAITVTFAYLPGRPVTGIYQREITGINKEDTVVFDTAYAYKFDNSVQKFVQLGTATWTGASSDLFWATNYRGSLASDRLLFATNFKVASTDPIRYFDGTNWNNFNPTLSEDTPPNVLTTTKLFQARFILPYYGRLLFFNTYEGTESGSYAGATNFFNRCRFSQIGNPLESDAFRVDIFGKGGFVDCPVNQEIMGVGFFRNTLIVRMEHSTWMLRYVGEYGLPFIWEQIDASLGAESYFSSIPLDTGLVSIGDKGITMANPSAVDRIDEKIKNLVFNISNSNNSPERVVGAREYRRQILYWCYSDAQLGATFPNRVLVYNYFENNWSIFRDNVTFFGLFQNPTGITWDSTGIFWDDGATYWDDPENQSYYPFIVSGNQEGYIHYYNDTTALENQGSLSITAIDRSTTPPRLTITNHNLADEELIYLYDMNFVTLAAGTTLSSSFNEAVFQVVVIDANTVEIYKWDGSIYVDNYSFTPANGTGTYMGGGQAVLLPVLDLVTKDFSPFADGGKGCKFVKADFLMDATESGQFAVRTYSDTSFSGQGNSQLLQDSVDTYAISGYYLPNSQYASHPFYALTSGSYIRLQYTMDDALMNDTDILEDDFVLNGANLYFRPGGKLSY